MEVNFWKSAGLHLVEQNADGWLKVTPDLIRAYLTRPEVHPIDGSCSNEVALFEALMEIPFVLSGTLNWPPSQTMMPPTTTVSS